MMSLPRMEEQAKERYSNIKAKKYTQLLNKSKTINIKKRVLDREATMIRKESNKSIKWSSPFKDTDTFKSKFQGKDIIAKKFEGFKAN